MPSAYQACRMTSSPLTSLNAFFFGSVSTGLISSSLPVRRRVFTDAQGTLHIRAAVPEDAGNYSCYAGSALGWDEQVITLEFTGTRSPPAGGIPGWARAQSCRRRDSSSLCTVPWLLPGTLRDTSYGMGLSMIGGVGGQPPGLRGLLGVSGTAASAAGDHRSRLSPRGAEPPAILAVTPTVKALVGEDVTLECWVSGVPPPHVAWYKGEAGKDLGSKPPPCTGGPQPPCGDVTRGVPHAGSGRDPGGTRGADAGVLGQGSRRWRRSRPAPSVPSCGCRR